VLISLGSKSCSTNALAPAQAPEEEEEDGNIQPTPEYNRETARWAAAL